MKKKGLGTAGFYAVILLIFVAAVYFLNPSASKETLKYSDVVSAFENRQVKSFTVEDTKLTYELVDGSKKTYKLYDVGLFFQDTNESIKAARSEGTLSYDLKPPFEFPWWGSFAFSLIVVVIIGAVFLFSMNQMNGGGKAMSFGKMKIKSNTDAGSKVTFADVAGADEEKSELEELVDFLKNPKKYTDLGARIPKGVLLVGPPGTGKTLIAKAVAGEAGVPFFSLSGSDFVELYVGVGASRVRDLFEQAKKSAPSIVFIDEIDAVGRQRGAGLGGGHDEREQTLNQLLVEMDGFAVNQGVIIIAATNRPDILDNALLRPGRFDRQVMVSRPDIKGREEILKVHARGKKISPEVDFNRLAKGTSGFTGADLENILNEAALLTARRKKPLIDIADIEDAIRKVTVGIEKKARVVTEKDKKMTAFHEAGHAIVSKFLETQDPVHEISIIPRGMAGGYTLYLPGEDKDYLSKTEMEEDIVSLLGGRVAEKLALDDVTTGASNDIERATSIARKMITRYGMSEKLGPIVFCSDHDEVFLGRDFTTQRNYSENIAAQIDEEVKLLMDDAYNKASKILTDKMDKLIELANLLIEKEKISGEEFNALFGEAPEKNTDAEANETARPEIITEPEESKENAGNADTAAPEADGCDAPANGGKTAE